MSADETEADIVSSQPASASNDDGDDWLAAEAAAADITQAGLSTPLTTNTNTLQGVAQLVLHPSGAISGHFVALNTHSTTQPNSNKTAGTHGGKPDSSPTTATHNSSSSSKALCLCLQGRQVLGIHSCYRDPEWALLQLSVMRYSGSADAGETAASAAVTAGLLLASSPPGAAAAAAPDTAAAAPAGTVTVADTAEAAAAAGTKAAAAAGQEADALSGAADAGSVQAEAVAWVQRKGGDLVTLEPADFDDEDTEAAVMAGNLVSAAAVKQPQVLRQLLCAMRSF